MVNYKNFTVLGLGSNIGNREKNINNAVRKLPLRCKKISRFYYNQALLPNNAKKNWDLEYLNIIVIGFPIFDVLTTFHKIKKIEKQLGRRKSQKWSPRVIDIDILFWGKKIISTNFLTIPHIHISKRDFVLNPMNNFAGNFIHPKYSINVRQMLKNYIKNHGEN